MPSHYLNQCWFIVNWNLRSKLQLNSNRDSNILNEENAFENVVWELSAIFSRSQCVNSLSPSDPATSHYLNQWWYSLLLHICVTQHQWVNTGTAFSWMKMIRCVIFYSNLTHWGWVTHICVSKLTITGSNNGLSPDRHQAIIWTNAGLLLIGPLGTNFSEILIEILTFSFKKMRLKVSSAKQRPFCLGLNVLTDVSSSWSRWQ